MKKFLEHHKVMNAINNFLSFFITNFEAECDCCMRKAKHGFKTQSNDVFYLCEQHAPKI